MIHDVRNLPACVRKEDTELCFKLGSLPFDFYLTGSYFFGCATPESDVDWIVQDSKEVRDALRDLGFTSVFEEVDYDCTDIGTADVWQRDNVQVQLAHSVTVRRNVRDVLFTYLREEHKEAGRIERGNLWNDLTTILSFRNKK